MSGHSLDFETMYCERCGQSKQDIINLDLDCHTAENVIAISHLRARKRLEELIAAVRWARWVR